MKKQLKGLNLVMSLLVFFMSVMSVAGLALPVHSVWHVTVKYDYTGYVLNGFNTLTGHDILGEYSGLIAGLNWLFLITGITCLLFAFLSAFLFEIKIGRRAEMSVVIMAEVSSFLYMIEGIVANSMASASWHPTTYAPVLFVLQTTALVAYFIVNHFAVKNNDEVREHNVPANAEPQYVKHTVAAAPVNAADELTKLKQLLDMGVITQEEFDAKKKELLNI